MTDPDNGAGNHTRHQVGGRVLFIVYYLPPMGSSGVQRPLKLIKYLPRFGWQPVVVAPVPGIYHTFDQSLLDELNETGAEVHRVQGNTLFHAAGDRSFGLSALPESARSVLRSISSWVYLPDNKKGWIKPAISKCNEILASDKIDVIFSTAPPYSNHLIAADLGKRHGIPVVMDFRDDWLGSHLLNLPTALHRNKMARFEKKTLQQASLITAINQTMLLSLRSRNDDEYLFAGTTGRRSDKQFMVLPQGFDPADFPDTGRNTATGKVSSDRIKITYSGIFYGSQQPDVFLGAVKYLMDQNYISGRDIELVFQGGLEKPVLNRISELGLEGVITNKGYLPHRKSVGNLSDSDLLWFTVGRQKNDNQVTTGKLFEYIGTGKPILGLVPDGEAARILDEYGAGFRAEPDNQKQVQQVLTEILSKLRSKRIPKADPAFIHSFNRIDIAGRLASRFDELKIQYTTGFRNPDE
ncbi:MAG: glycosyltransferase [Cyclonatronaceae bacterium]